ncbi:MAG: SsrA-binding protein [Flavobacteriaceae bacterium]
MSEFFTFATNLYAVKKHLFKTLAKINKAVLPSFSKRRLDLSKANKLQLAVLGWRIYITKRALD